MNLPQFLYERPSSITEAVDLLRENPNARLFAGGQTLIPTLKQRLTRPSLLVDLQDIKELRGISVTDEVVSIGAMTRHAETAASEEVQSVIPALAYLAGGIAHQQVRHMGTMGGSISNHDPASDYPAALVGLGAEVETSRRRIPADEFFTGLFLTALEPDELVVRIHFPRPKRAGYCKIPSQASGYVMTGCFIAETKGGIRVAVNGAGPCVFRQKKFEAALSESFSVNSLKGLTQDPKGLNNDMHATNDYRANLVVVAAHRALVSALSQTNNK